MNKTALLAAAATTVALVAGAGTPVASASVSSVCTSLNDTVYQAVSATGAALYTTSQASTQKFLKQGFTAQGAAFLASKTAGTGLVGVHRMYRTVSKDYLYTTKAKEVSSAVTRYGYVDQGVVFYTATQRSACTQVAPRLVKGNQHRLDTTGALASLTSAGWRKESASFNVVPTPHKPTQPSTFTFAVVPDTQLEVLKSNDVRLAARNRWLATQHVSFVAQTGDLVNWDTDAHEQYQRAKDAMSVLSDHKIPYTVAVGNHDTMATGHGGSARPGKTSELVRDTKTLNHYFTAADFGDVGGAFEPGKIDNVYTTYAAGNEKWMVITLEFCARKPVIDWARSVVASHPDYNVIISTHYFLTGKATIGQDNAGYGATTPQYVYDRLVSQYPNIKMVFSGHVGYAQKSRVDTGVHGNKIHSFLTTFHEGLTNPVRMLTVDTTKDTVTSKIYAPFTDRTWHEYDEKVTDLTFS